MLVINEEDMEREEQHVIPENREENINKNIVSQHADLVQTSKARRVNKGLIDQERISKYAKLVTHEGGIVKKNLVHR
jgi:hypothetical protein